MAVKFTNNAATTLAAGINSSVTSIAVTDGSVFPTITGSDHFYVTFDDTTNKEIVKVTARSGNTLTVVRGHDNTTARAFSSGDKAELRIVAALLEDVKTDISSTLTVDTFTGDDSTTAFTLSVAPASEDNLIVFIEGVYQNPGDFTLSGTTLTLDVAPLAGRKIIVYHVSHLVAGNNLTHNQFTCNGSTTAFTLSLAPGSENNTQAFLDGVYQQKTDYAVSGTTLTMDTAPANGAILEVMTFTQTEVNTLPASFVSGLTQVTAVGADHFMIFDATDSALKKSLVSDVLESATSISTSADATAITIDSNEKVTFTSDVTTGGHLSVGGNNNELRFYEGANYVGFEAPALSADKIWVLPAADGSNGQVIKTDGSGNLSFATVSGTTINNNADNRIITGSGTTNTLEGESNLTYDGSTFTVNGNALNTQISPTTGTAQFYQRFSSDGGNHYIGVANSAGAGLLSGAGAYSLNIQTEGARNLALGTNNALRMLIDSSGNVGIGQASDGDKLHVLGTGLFEDSRATGVGIKIHGGSGSAFAHIGVTLSNPLTFQTADTERMRLHGGGDLTVATTTAIGSMYNGVSGIGFGYSSGGYGACVRGGTNTPFYVSTNSQGAGGFIEFAQGGATRGNITYTGSATSYNASSDYRLKENAVPIENALSKIDSLNPINFDWIESGDNSDGFLAHEIQAVLPYTVTGTKDEVYTDENSGEEKTNGQPKYQVMDYAKLTPVLVKAIQEQQTIIDDLKSRIETLEG